MHARTHSPSWGKLRIQKPKKLPLKLIGRLTKGNTSSTSKVRGVWCGAFPRLSGTPPPVPPDLLCAYSVKGGRKPLTYTGIACSDRHCHLRLWLAVTATSLDKKKSSKVNTECAAFSTTNPPGLISLESPTELEKEYAHGKIFEVGFTIAGARVAGEDTDPEDVEREIGIWLGTKASTICAPMRIRYFFRAFFSLLQAHVRRALHKLLLPTLMILKDASTPRHTHTSTRL